MEFKDLLKIVQQKQASDLFITAGVPPSIKLNGAITPLTRTPLTGQQSMELVLRLMNDAQRREFEETNECNFALEDPDVGRFRVSAFIQRNQAGMVLRRIETEIPKVDELGLPPAVKELAMLNRGLVLVVGGTGSGKSTSLAAMLGHRNQYGRGHIITIEDPIEFMHPQAGCIMTQREVGVDTESFEIALKNTLRQAPDVILIGEVRTRETMEYAIQFAETGHLCLATLHANNANQALDRIIHFFPEDRRTQLLMDLSLNLKAVLAQQLVPTIDGKGRRLAAELMIVSPLISELIRKGEVHRIKEVMKRSEPLGMQTFDQALYKLHQEGAISEKEALNHADSANDLRLMIKLGHSPDSAPDSDGLSLMQDDEDPGKTLPG